MVQSTILNAISSGNVTDEQIQTSTGLSPKAIEFGIKELITNGIIAIDGSGNYYNCYSYGGSEVTPKTTSTKAGGNMKTTPIQTNGPSKGKKKKLNCTPEQKDFAELICSNKGKIFNAQDEGQTFIHRGAQVLFGGCGDQAIRYKIAISGFSDKSPVEYAVMYLDWDDSALYEEDGLADQLKAIVGKPKPKIAPAITAQVGAK